MDRYDNKMKVISAIVMVLIMLPMFASIAFSAGDAYPTSAGASKSLKVDSIGMEIMDDNITLYGVLNDDLLEPFGASVSDFPWSKEDVSFTITKYGEIPQFETDYEHIYSGFPVQGWILEVDFLNGAGQTGNYTRYWWAQYSKPGAMRNQWRSTDVNSAYKTAVIPDGFRLVVNTTRLAVVKVDLVMLMKDNIGIVRGPITGNFHGVECQGGFNLHLNLTYVFFKDKKYIIEYKNIYSKVEKWVADLMDVQFMQDVEFDVDWGAAENYRCDAYIYSVAPKNSTYWAYQLGMEYWPYNYTLAIVEPDEQALPSIPGTDHTGYVAFYPNLSNWDVRFFDEAGDPPDLDLKNDPASNNYRNSISLGSSDLIMGAWNFTLIGDGQIQDYHLMSLMGAAEEHWDTNDDAIPESSGGSLFEIAWALNETFSPHYQLNDIDTYNWWPFAGDGEPDQKYFGATPSNWPWWDGQKEGWRSSTKENLAMFIVGDTDAAMLDEVRKFGAATWDNLAAIDVAQAFGVALGYTAGSLKEPIYRSALDTAAAVYQDGFVGLHRWYHYSSEQRPTQISSHVDWCNDPTTTPGYIDTTEPYKTNVWHILTFGGPDVNVVTNYFNDFGFSYYVGAWPTSEEMQPDLPGDAMTPDAYYVPGSKHVYYDYKVSGACHYFARVSLVMDMNITRETKSPPDLYPWAAMIIDGLRAEGTVAAGQFVAHTWNYWEGWDLFDTMNDGAVSLILEFVDNTQDGHIDSARVVEVIGTVGTSLTELPDVIW